MIKHIRRFAGRPVNGLTYIWLVTIATIVGLGFLAWGAITFGPN
jgi:hypothetical protein